MITLDDIHRVLASIGLEDRLAAKTSSVFRQADTDKPSCALKGQLSDIDYVVNFWISGEIEGHFAPPDGEVIVKVAQASSADNGKDLIVSWLRELSY